MKDIAKCQHLNHKNKCYGENIYNKVDNDKRLNLLKLVKEEGKSLKDAAKSLNINYSTAKTILRVYRIENRILKKSPYQKRNRRQKNKTFHFNVSNFESNNSLNNLNFSDSSNQENNFINLQGNKEKIIENLENNITILQPVSKFSQSSSSNFSALNPYENQGNYTDTCKSTEEFMENFYSLVNMLKSCISEIINNDNTIRSLNNILKNMNVNGNSQNFYKFEVGDINQNNLSEMFNRQNK